MKNKYSNYVHSTARPARSVAPLRFYKKMMISAALAVFGFLMPAAQGSVLVLSQESRIFGSWMESGYVDGNGDLVPSSNESGQAVSGVSFFKRTRSFDTTSTSAASLGEEVKSEPFGFTAGSATTRSFYLAMSGYAVPYYVEGIQMNLEVTANTATRFRPLGTRLTLEAEGYVVYNYWDEEQDFWLRLMNVTTGERLLYVHDMWPSGAYGGLENKQSFSFSVNPDHEYELDHGGFFIAFDAKDVSGMSQLRLHSVPEHGDGAGWVALICLAGLVFQQQKHRHHLMS